MSWDRSPLDAVNVIRKQANGQVVLVLQGGGALGAYQGGVYEALHEAKVEPDWIIGTSIGAINASIIAGNAVEHRLDRLREFWRRVERNDLWSILPSWTGIGDSLSAWATMTRGIPGFFEANPLAFLGAHVPLGTDTAGYYSTMPLRKTLDELIDFSLIKKNTPRLMVGAAHVRTSMMRYFDSRDGEIGVEHIMASGALPPAFPAVRIDGELFWDGGILSNTPTEAIFDDNPRRNSLIFAVHMWNPTGPEPETIWEVMHRHKDIQYSSRIANHISRQRRGTPPAPCRQRAREARAGRGSQVCVGARTCGLWLPDPHARGAALGAAARKRKPHQGYRFQPFRNPRALASRLCRYLPGSRSRSLDRRVWPARRRRAS
jgi:NTE family protein